MAMLRMLSSKRESEKPFDIQSPKSPQIFQIAAPIAPNSVLGSGHGARHPAWNKVTPYRDCLYVDRPHE
jgi:hypothetical protein